MCRHCCNKSATTNASAGATAESAKTGGGTRGGKRRLHVMILRLFLAALLCAIAASGSAAQDAPAAPTPAPRSLPDELVLTGDNVIDVLLNGVPIRLEVTAEAFGLPIINPDIAVQLQLLTEFRRGWRYGPVVVNGGGAVQALDFGAGAAAIPITWTQERVTERADGIIGVHHLPYARVTFALAPPTSVETIQRFAIKRTGGDDNTRLGTEVTVGKKRLMMIFVPERADNLITAPTANFIATHQEGGFVPGSDGVAVMNFGVERPIRMMRLAQPIELGELPVERFAVRVEDYGDPKRVGEISENDPRFQKGQILVSRRKGRGKPDLLTRIGRDQIGHCSTLTYDLELAEIQLSCAAQGD